MVGLRCQPTNAAVGLWNWFLSSVYFTGAKILKASHHNLLMQLVKEDILTPEELSWFPGSLVLGQVLGILLGPLLADLVQPQYLTF